MPMYFLIAGVRACEQYCILNVFAQKRKPLLLLCFLFYYEERWISMNMKSLKWNCKNNTDNLITSVLAPWVKATPRRSRRFGEPTGDKAPTAPSRETKTEPRGFWFPGEKRKKRTWTPAKQKNNASRTYAYVFLNLSLLWRATNEVSSGRRT